MSISERESDVAGFLEGYLDMNRTSAPLSAAAMQALNGSKNSFDLRFGINRAVNGNINSKNNLVPDFDDDLMDVHYKSVFPPRETILEYDRRMSEESPVAPSGGRKRRRTRRTRRNRRRRRTYKKNLI